MQASNIVRYRVSFWTKCYNKDKINILLTANTGETTLVENLTPEQGCFLLEMLKTPGVINCDPESLEGLVYLVSERAS